VLQPDDDSTTHQPSKVSVCVVKKAEQVKHNSGNSAVSIRSISLGDYKSVVDFRMCQMIKNLYASQI